MQGAVLSGAAMQELLILVCNHVLGGLGRVEISRNALHLARLSTRREHLREGPPGLRALEPVRPLTHSTHHA